MLNRLRLSGVLCGGLGVLALSVFGPGVRAAAVYPSAYDDSEFTDVLDPAKHPRAAQEIPLNAGDARESFGNSEMDPDPLKKLTGFVTDGFRKAFAFFDEARAAFGARAEAAVERRMKRLLLAWETSLKETQRALGGATLTVPAPGTTFQACADHAGVLAFVIQGSVAIHICPLALQGNYDDKGLAQILIHEAAHVAGI